MLTEASNWPADSCEYLSFCKNRAEMNTKEASSARRCICLRCLIMSHFFSTRLLIFLRASRCFALCTFRFCRNRRLWHSSTLCKRKVRYYEANTYSKIERFPWEWSSFWDDVQKCARKLWGIQHECFYLCYCISQTSPCTLSFTSQETDHMVPRHKNAERWDSNQRFMNSRQSL